MLLWAILAPNLEVFVASWFQVKDLGITLVQLGFKFGFGASWCQTEGSLGHLGSKLGGLGTTLGHLGSKFENIFGVSWFVVSTCFC